MLIINKLRGGYWRKASDKWRKKKEQMRRKHGIFAVINHYLTFATMQTSVAFVQLVRAFVLLSIAFIGVRAQTPSQKIGSAIKSVTVFLSGAQVLRTATGNVRTGKSEIVLTGISPYLDESSIQVKSDGTDCTIMAVSWRKNYLDLQTQQVAIEALLQQKGIVNKKKAAAQGNTLIRQQQRKILDQNLAVGGSNTGLNTSELKNNVAYQTDRLTELLRQDIAAQDTLSQLSETANKIDQQLNELNAQRTRITSEVVVTVYATKNTNIALFISYRTDRANWYAAYDLRAKETTQPITLSYRAYVAQASGEDWSDVQLSLSTGNPAINQVRPQPDTWYLHYNNGSLAQQAAQFGKITVINNVITQISGKVVNTKTNEPIPFATVMPEGTTIGTQTDFDGNYNLQIPAGVNKLRITYIGYEEKTVVLTDAGRIALKESDQVLNAIVIPQAKMPLEEIGLLPTRNVNAISANTAGVYGKITAQNNMALQEQRYQGGTTYVIEQPYTIVADGKSQLVEIKTYTIPTDYEYYCVPKLNTAVFLTARIPDWEDLNLPDGEVSLFFENTYVGKSLLNTQQTADTLAISLGIDPDIIVERNKQTQQSSRQTLGNKKTERRAWEIKVRNTKAIPINLIIEDQLPVSTDKEIEVKDAEYGNAVYNEQNGQLKWLVELPIRQEKKISFSYTVQYPKNQIINLE